MHPLLKHLSPNRQAFGNDPFGYSSLAWQRWCIAQTVSGFPSDPSRTPSSRDLKSPILWLSQAKALAEASKSVLDRTPTWEESPLITRGITDSQFCAVGLMLLGYSLEVCLKTMHILRDGIDTYQLSERDFKHHRLVDLAKIVPDLDERDQAILQLLTEFSYWAGRYPDPGSGRESLSEGIFDSSEKHRITAKDVFALSERIAKHVQSLISTGAFAA